MDLKEVVLPHIEKLVGELKSNDELKEVLKRRFTKKEYKIFISLEEGIKIEDIEKQIGDTKERIEKLYKSACKKLNQEKIKQELVKSKSIT